MMVSLKGPLAFLITTASRPLTRRNAVAACLSTCSFLVASSSRPKVAVAAAFAADINHQQPQESNTCLLMSTSSTSSERIVVDMDTGYLDAKSASVLDQELMSEPGFSLEQLMELAGLSVAEAVYAVVTEKQRKESNKEKSKTTPHILLVCGPGNNGGDGLVAARHLVMFGFECSIVYPKQSKQQHFVNLVQQCRDVGIQFLDEMPKDDSMSSFAAIVDSIFGFSFHGEPREPFATILKDMKRAKQQQGNDILVVSVDVPSGWNVDEGDVANTGFLPDVVISLTAPKLCMKQFEGRHFVGGRFLPPALGAKYGVRMPNYPGFSQVVEVVSSRTKKSSGWEGGYAAHLAEKEAMEFAAYAKIKPSEDSWEAQYAAYLAEKEAKEKR